MRVSDLRQSRRFETVNRPRRVGLGAAPSGLRLRTIQSDRAFVWSLGQKQLLVESRSDIVDRLDSLEIIVIWREKKVFLDNVNGQFT